MKPHKIETLEIPVDFLEEKWAKVDLMIFYGQVYAVVKSPLNLDEYQNDRLESIAMKLYWEKSEWARRTTC